MAPVKLPRFVMFKGDNDSYLCVFNTEGHPYLCFNSTGRNLWGAHEVVPVSGQENVVMIKSLHDSGWWRRSPNWIWTDLWQTPTASHQDCLFKVVQLSPNKVALQCLANDRYVKRLTTEGKTSCLNACATDHNRDVTAQLEVSEALATRRVFDVKYLKDQLETSSMEPMLLGSATAKNNTSSTSDLAVTITYEKSETATWSNSTTFTTGLAVTVSAGIPFIGDAEFAVSAEIGHTTEMGKENRETVTVSSTFTVKDVRPGEQVTVRVSGTKATGTVPYTYKYQDTLIDGTVFPEDTGVDGIFKGVRVVDIKWEATDTSGTKKSAAEK